MNYDIFKNKRVCLFIPHQDDEINIAYGLLYTIKDIAKDIKVVYSTNGNYVVNEKYRLKEGIKSLEKIGIKKSNIIFMGYSDQIPEGKTHIYHEKELWIDSFNNSSTKTPYDNDYHYLKTGKHAQFNRKNFEFDIKSIIEETYPEVIITVDFDSHPDHRALSLSIERVLGEILKKNNKYQPILLKSFAYPTSYKGYDDFGYNNKNTRFLLEENSYSKMQNPYYKWSDRIMFKNHKKGTSYLFLKNIYFYGLLEHKSQYILNRINQIINNDLVFFERNTKNLLLNAKQIKTSSGNPNYLNDFMLFDSSNILGGVTRKIELDEGFTILEKNDKEKRIDIVFNTKVNINIIKIYIKPETSKNIKKISILVNGVSKEYEVKYDNNIYTLKDLNIVEAKELSILINCNENIHIGELELLHQEERINYALLEINGDVHNDYYSSIPPKVGIISNVDYSNLRIKKENNKVQLYKDSQLIDTIILHKENKLKLMIIKKINDILLLLGRVYQKIIKIVRKLAAK